MEVPAKIEDNPMVPTEREASLWDYTVVPDAELKIVIAEVADGRSLKDVVRTNSAIKSNYREIVRALHQDPEVKKVFTMACGVQISGFIDNIIEEAEADIADLPDFLYRYKANGEKVLDKLYVNLWLQNRKLKIDAYTKAIRAVPSRVASVGVQEEDSGNGITINIQQFTNEKLKEAKTITVDACKENELDA